MRAELLKCDKARMGCAVLPAPRPALGFSLNSLWSALAQLQQSDGPVAFASDTLSSRSPAESKTGTPFRERPFAYVEAVVDLKTAPEEGLEPPTR